MIHTIRPYWLGQQLVFDDPSVGLAREALVAGTDDVLAELAGVHPGGESFTVLFSSGPFPGHTHSVTRTRTEGGGNWYTLDGTDKEGWLCPALFRYYDEAPEKLYIQVKK